MHERYQALLDKADWSVRNNRDVFHILDEDVIRARLYAYGYRTQTIGAFHACKVSLIEALGSSGSESCTFQMLMGILDELQSLATIPVPEDFRALIYTLHTYDRGVQNACDSFEKLLDETRSDAVLRIKRSFQKAMARVSSGNGIYVAQDNILPEQGSFVVPNLGITIVPLIYGEHHSWNSTHLPGPCIDATNHRHHAGVEIHLGYSPVHGITMLDRFRSQIREGYAMPIPVMIDHGLDNLSDQEHWVPFIFGSLTLGGWGVFFDVEPRPAKAQDLRKAPLESPEMGNSVFIERVIERVAQLDHSHREIVIPAAATASGKYGALQLGISRVTQEGRDPISDRYTIISVVSGAGTIEIGPTSQSLRVHDHVGIPAKVPARIEPSGADPLVLLDAVITEAPN